MWTNNNATPQTILPSISPVQSLSSDSLQPHGLQHTRPPCLSPTPGACSNPCPSIASVMLSNHLILCRPLLLLPSIFSSIRVLSNESALCIKWPMYWSFRFSITPSNEYSGLIFFRMNCLTLLAVQGTLKSLLQHHSSKASILQHSAFFIIQLSHPYMTTGKTIALTKWNFLDEVMSLLFNMQSRLVIDFPSGSDGKASAYNAGDRLRSLGWEDPLEKDMATHSSTLAWKIPWMEEHGRLQSMGLQRVGHDWATSLGWS